MIIEQVNVAALATVAEFIAGPEAAAKITALYRLIDEAQYNAYQQGVIAGQESREDDVEAAFDEGWDNGYDAGKDDGLDAADSAYIQGVADARARPAVADENVAASVAKLSQNALNGEYDAEMVQDSGDVDEDEEMPEGYCIICRSTNCADPITA